MTKIETFCKADLFTKKISFLLTPRKLNLLHLYMYNVLQSNCKKKIGVWNIPNDCTCNDILGTMWVKNLCYIIQIHPSNE